MPWGVFIPEMRRYSESRGMKMSRRRGLVPGAVTLALLAWAFADGAAIQAAQGDVSPPPEVIRRFSAEVVSLDAKQGLVALVHGPSGYQFTGLVTASTRVTITQFFDPREITEGSIVEAWGQIDSATHQVRAGECRASTTNQLILSAKPELNWIGGRLYRQVGEPVEPDSWTTADGKTALVLETADHQRWRLLHGKAQPVAFRYRPGSPQDLLPGREVEVVVADRGGRGDLREAVVDAWFPGAETRQAIGRSVGNGPSGMTAARFSAQLQAVEHHYAQIADELARLMPVNLRLWPQLVLVGEPVHLELRARSLRPPQPKAVIWLDYFHTNEPLSQELILDWHRQGEQAGLPVYRRNPDREARPVPSRVGMRYRRRHRQVLPQLCRLRQ